MSSLDHIIVFLLLYIIFFFIISIGQKKLDSDFWKFLCFPIIIYSLAYGLRYGWGVDYIRYQDAYEFQKISHDYDIGFAFVGEILHTIGLDKFWMELIIFSFLFIFSILLCLHLIENNKYMIVLILPATMSFSSTAIRQALSISFVFLGLYFLLQEKRKKYLYVAIFLSVAYSIHGASLTFFLPIFVVYLLRFNKPIPLSIALMMYLSSIFFSEFFIGQLTSFMDKYVGLLFATDHLQSYVDNYEKVFANEQEEIFGHNGIFLYFEYIGRMGIIVLSSLALSKVQNPHVSIFFNLFLIGMCLQQIFFNSEILHRVADPFYMLYFIPLGYAYSIFIGSENQKKMGLKITILVTLLYTYYPIYKFIFFFKSSSFVWNL